MGFVYLWYCTPTAAVSWVNEAFGIKFFFQWLEQLMSMGLWMEKYSKPQVLERSKKNRISSPKLPSAGISVLYYEEAVVIVWTIPFLYGGKYETHCLCREYAVNFKITPTIWQNCTQDPILSL
jgi:hypothetical protein